MYAATASTTATQISPIVPACKLLGSSPLYMHVPLWQPSLMSSPTSASLSTSSPALCESPADSLGGRSPCPWSLRKPNARRAMGATVLSSSMALARGAARERERERSSPSSLMAIRPLTAMSKAGEQNDGVAHTALPMLHERGREKGDEKGRERSDENDVECSYEDGHVRSSPALCSPALHMAYTEMLHHRARAISRLGDHATPLRMAPLSAVPTRRTAQRPTTALHMKSEFLIGVATPRRPLSALSPHVLNSSSNSKNRSSS